MMSVRPILIRLIKCSQHFSGYFRIFRRLCQTEQEVLTGLYRDSVVTEEFFTAAIEKESLCLRIIFTEGPERLQVPGLNLGSVFYLDSPKTGLFYRQQSPPQFQRWYASNTG